MEKIKKLTALKIEIDELLETVKFYNENFSKIQDKSENMNKLYFEHLSNRYEKLLHEREEILRG